MRPAGTATLLALLAALPVSACISGSLRSGEERRPPRIPFNQLDPPQGLVVITDPQSQLPATFKVLVFEDANVEDTLTARWFVDYHRTPAIQQQAVRPPEPNSPTPNLRAGSTFTLTASMLEPDPSAEAHLIEVVVTDRPFDDPGEEGRRNRTFAPDGDGDVVSWTVEIQTGTPAKPSASTETSAVPALLPRLPVLRILPPDEGVRAPLVPLLVPPLSPPSQGAAAPGSPRLPHTGGDDDPP